MLEKKLTAKRIKKNPVIAGLPAKLSSVISPILLASELFLLLLLLPDPRLDGHSEDSSEVRLLQILLPEPLRSISEAAEVRLLLKLLPDPLLSSIDANDEAQDVLRLLPLSPDDLR